MARAPFLKGVAATRKRRAGVKTQKLRGKISTGTGRPFTTGGGGKGRRNVIVGTGRSATGGGGG